jgi:hypothetical protein
MKYTKHSLASRMAHYGLLSAGAVAAAAAFAPSANASVISFTPESPLVNSPANLDIFFAPTSASASFTVSSADEFAAGKFPVESNAQVAIFAAERGAGMAESAPEMVARLGSGALIGPSNSAFGFSIGYIGLLGGSNGSQVAGAWAPGDFGFVGLEFPIGSNAEPNYGWAELTILPDYYVQLDAWGYETTPGVPIAAGATGSAIPEPGSLALLATGMAGLALYRRRRASRVEKS